VLKTQICVTRLQCVNTDGIVFVLLKPLEVFSVFLISPPKEIVVLSNKYQKCSYVGVFVSTFYHVLE